MDPVIGLAGIASAGQLYANWQNLAESKRARQWSERMAGSAVQRRMADLRLAGINPMLAGMDAAQTPGASMGRVEDPLGPGVHSGLAAQRQKAELDQLKRVALNVNADTVLKDAQRKEALARTAVSRRQAMNTALQTKMMSAELPALLNAARVESSKFGAGAAWVDRFMRTMLGPITSAAGLGMAGRALRLRSLSSARTDAGIRDLFGR